MNEDEMESASPEVYAFLEAEDYGYVIRLPAHAVLQRRIAHLPPKAGQRAVDLGNIGPHLHHPGTGREAILIRSQGLVRIEPVTEGSEDDASRSFSPRSFRSSTLTRSGVKFGNSETVMHLLSRLAKTTAEANE
jgi:hypothetical protein